MCLYGGDANRGRGYRCDFGFIMSTKLIQQRIEHGFSLSFCRIIYLMMFVLWKKGKTWRGVSHMYMSGAVRCGTARLYCTYMGGYISQSHSRAYSLCSDASSN